MKITTWRMPARFGGTIQPRAFWYVAIMPTGEEGMGDTPAQAIADARHEYRQMRDNLEVGYCRMGRFHK